MSRALLDVNVLVALLDREHLDHDRARAWLEAEVVEGWASCPITENWLVRILSQPRYPNPVSVAAAVGLLAGARRSPHHEFWPCDVSLLESAAVDHTRLLGSRQVTDVYLLALAAAHGGRFVTFDRAVPLAAVRAASQDHLTVL